MVRSLDANLFGCLLIATDACGLLWMQRYTACLAMRERQCAGFVIRSVQLRFKRATSTAGQDGNRDRAQRSPSEPLETGYPAIAEHTQRLAQRFFLFYSPVCGRQPTANRAKSQLPACAPLDAG